MIRLDLGLLLFFLLYFFSAAIQAENNNAEKKETNTNDSNYFIIDDFYPLSKGSLQVTVFPVFANGNIARDTFFPIFATYGLTNNWEIYTTYNTYTFHRSDLITSQGHGDLGIGLSYNFTNLCDKNAYLTLRFNLQNPIAEINKELTDGLQRYNPGIIYAHDYPSLKWTHQFVIETGFNFVHRVKRSDIEFIPSAHYFILDLGYSLRSQNLTFSLELSWSINTWNNHGEDNQLYLTPGITYVFPNDLQIGLGTAFGLTPQSYQTAIIFQVVYEFDLLPKKNGSK